MRSKKLSAGLAGVLAIFSAILFVTGTHAAAQTERVLHSFGSGTDGWNPEATLIFDGSGNLYGTTESGGAYDYGTVFEMIPKLGGGWSEKILHSFNNTNGDGTRPFGGLVFDTEGNLYGTTSGGAPITTGEQCSS